MTTAENIYGNARTAIHPESPLPALQNCFLFASLLFRYPEERIYSEIEQHLPVFNEFFMAYGKAVPSLPPAAELQPEYVGLFVNNKGFVPAVPYAGCHLDDGRLKGESYFRLRRMMAETGFQLDPSVPELADHLAIILEFAGHLIGAIIDKQTTGNDDRRETNTLAEVIEHYIRPVVDAVGEKIDEYASLEFYRIAARTLQAFVHDASGFYEAD